MSERPPVTIDVNGVAHTFTYDTTECHIYRDPIWDSHNHVQFAEYGTQVVRIFNAPRLVMYLAGIELAHNDGLDEKAIAAVTSEMDERFGWNAHLVVQDEPSDLIKDRYIAIASRVLQTPKVFVPKEWV